MEAGQGEKEATEAGQGEKEAGTLKQKTNLKEQVACDSFLTLRPM